jgi:NAD(P)-dependent dehydrogenase (short-subunit alcohol dehydrogenase family)
MFMDFAAYADLRDQVAIVTGASSGLGVRFAEVLAAAGAKVALVARRVDRLEEVAARIADAGGMARAFAADMTDADGLKALVPAVEEALGPRDHPGEQRRHPRRATGGEDAAGADRPRAGRECARALHPELRGGAATD